MFKSVIAFAMTLAAGAANAATVQCFTENKKAGERLVLNIDLKTGGGGLFVMNENTFEISDGGWYQIGFYQDVKAETGLFQANGLSLKVDFKQRLTESACKKSLGVKVCSEGVLTATQVIQGVAATKLENLKVACRKINKTESDQGE